MNAKTRIKLLFAHFPRLGFFAWYCYAVLNGFAAILFRLRLLGIIYLPFGVKLTGIRHIKIGTYASIGTGTWLNVNHRNVKYPGIIIGSHTIIGLDNFFSSGHSITIGEYCLTTRFCSFIGSSHIYDAPEFPYAMTGTTSQHKIVVGDNCFFGVGAKVLGNVTIGRGCIIGSGAVVQNSIPPFSLVVGAPAAVIKRFNFSTRRWVDPDQYSDIGIPQEDEYRKMLRKNGRGIQPPFSALGGLFFDVP